MNKTTVQTAVAKAIQKADTSYFFSDYPKQAAAVLKALDAQGYVLVQKDLPPDLFLQAANEMKTGRVKPEEHVKDVYQTILRILAGR